MKLFLDDVRNPSDCAKYMYLRVGALNTVYLEGDWYIVRNYDEFVIAIVNYHKIITHISFDHDLADDHYHESMNDKEAYEKHLLTITEKTGCDCAKFVRKYYAERGLSLPIMFVHSMNPVGVERIINVFRQ